MVKAELSYNPYLMETNIVFNGQKPRINSLVEKHQNETLQNWADLIPSIFYDEMNGYDFELEFSGTKLEYEDLTKAFIEANVSNDMVRIFHKNELEDRESKVRKIDDLMKWFEDNPNRKFDFASFKEFNYELIENEYVCVMLNGSSSAIEMPSEYKVSLENIENTRELDNTSLRHTPIIICIDDKTLPNLKENLRYFSERKDVSPNQLFFIVQPLLNTASVERTIRDLGIEKPQMISGIDDADIGRYLETYPVTDNIYNMIKILSGYEEDILDILAVENEESMISNKEIHEQIDELEDTIKRLKESLDLFANRDNLDLISELQAAKNSLYNSVQNWKNNKTKITKEYEAANLAQDLNDQVKRAYQEFCSKTKGIFIRVKKEIEIEYMNWYESAEYEIGFMPNVSCNDVGCFKEIDNISDELLEINEERYVMPKEDLLGMLFKSNDSKEITAVREITFYCQKWRDHAAASVEQAVHESIKNLDHILKTYAEELAESYKAQLYELIKDRIALKETVSQQLSDDEQKLQEDNDWLVRFHDQLKAIERG